MSYNYLLNEATGHRKKPIPLSHHEILGLTEPFTRRGHHVDLVASDRSNRRLVFKPVEHNDDVDAPANVREVLRLENPRPGFYGLSRVVTLSSGLEATLLTEGEQPGELLARLETVPWQDQFRAVAEAMVAHSYRLLPSVNVGPDGAPSIVMELTRGEAEVAGFNVILHAVTVKGYPADLDLIPKIDCPNLPDDLLAVLGWAWGPLSKKSDIGWRCQLRVRGNEPHRSRQMQGRLERTVAHLARTLAKSPQVFHDTQIRARWGVTFRRAIPLLLVVALIAAACALCFVEIPQDSIVNLLIQSAPPLLLCAVFGMRDTPKLEFPPIPRRSKETSWQTMPSEPPDTTTTLLDLRERSAG
jgi:hypothetical protein